MIRATAVRSRTDLRAVPASPHAHAVAVRRRLTPDGLLVLAAFVRAAAVYWRALVALSVGLFAWAQSGWLLAGIASLGVSWASILAAQVGSVPSGRSGNLPTTLQTIHATLLTRDGLRTYLRGRWRTWRAKSLIPDALEQIGFTKNAEGRRAWLTRVRPTRTGASGYVHVGKLGKTVDELAKQRERIASITGCVKTSVVEHKPGVARLWLHWDDALADELALTDMPPAPAGRLTFGLTETAAPASIAWGMSVLIAGMTRWGKSNVVWALLGELVRKGMPVRVRVSDPKGGVELARLGDRLGKNTGTLKVHAYAENAKQTEQLVADANRAMHARLADMKKRRRKTWTPTPEEPLDVLILDEALAVRSILKDGEKGPLGEILFMGSAAGFVVWLLTQAAQVDVLGRVRDFIPQRICLATPNRFSTDAALGDGAEADGAACSSIDQKGVGYAYHEGTRGYDRFRAPLVSDQQTRWIAAGRLTGPQVAAEEPEPDERQEDEAA